MNSRRFMASSSFDHLVGAQQQGSGQFDAERPRRGQIDDQRKLGGLLDRQRPRPDAENFGGKVSLRSLPPVFIRSPRRRGRATVAAKRRLKDGVNVRRTA
jgi:hypothetical protein